MRSFLSTHFYLFFVLICFWACEPKTVEVVEQKIETFSFEQFPDALVVIDHNQKSINVTLPYQTILSQLVPRIQITNGHSLVPASGIEQDFSKNVYYTLIQNKQKTVYTVKVKNAPQPQPIISQVLSDSVEAGFEVTLKGKNFGIFAVDVKAYLLGEEKMEVPFKLLDSNRVVVQIPVTVKPESYRIQIAVKALLALSEKSLVVGYPSPQVKKISHKHALLNDTLFVEAQYADASKYTFACELATSQNTYKLPFLLQRNGSLGFKLPTNVAVGTYKVKLLNVTTKKTSRETSFELTLFDPTKPFVTGVLEAKSTFKRGEVVTFRTQQFDVVKARFFQTYLNGSKKSYTQNGIYDAQKNTLQITLPTSMETGKYELSFMLSNPELGTKYNFQTDIVISISE